MDSKPGGESGPSDEPAASGSGYVPGDWAGLLQSLERHSRVAANATELAPWELLLDSRLESHHAVAALRDWSRVQSRLARLDPASEPGELYAQLHELATVPDAAGPGIANWLQRVLREPANLHTPGSTAAGMGRPRGLTPVNLHLARCIHADWLGRQVLLRTRKKVPPGPLALFLALNILERVHDPRYSRRPLMQALMEHGQAVRAQMQAEQGESWLTLPLGNWLEVFGRLIQARGFEGKVNALNRYDACLGSGFLHNGLAIPITLCALVQFLVHQVAGGDRLIRARGLNTPGHFLLLVEEGHEQIVVDPFRGLYNLTWKTLMQQMGARELAALTPEALVLDQPSDILPRMCLNALKRLENHQSHLLSAEYCTLHQAVSQDPNLLLQRALLRLRGHAHGLAREDLAVVMESDHEATAKLAQKFMMREDFYLSQHPN